MSATLFRGARIVAPLQDLDEVGDLLVDGGRIAAIGGTIEVGEGVGVFAANGLALVPGLIDPHVHLREPGQEYKETIESGSRAAAAGGFTAVVCMANTLPVNDCRSVTEHILRAAERAGLCRVYPVCAVSKGLRGEELAEIGDCVAAGAIAASDDGRPVGNPELMRRALLYLQHFDIPLVAHAQDMDLTAGGVMHEGAVSARLGLPGIPGAAEDAMVARDLLLAEDTGGRYHLQHLSTARSLQMMEVARARGIRATCEVTPHHLLLTEEAVADQRMSPNTKMNPPLRSAEDRVALVEGLGRGAIDCIASDHAPHHPDEKDLDFVAAPFGIVGLETTVSLCLDRLVQGRVLPLTRLVELLSVNPARLFGLPGGSLRVGDAADITLLDLELRVVVRASSFVGKSRNTPFEGWSLRGGAVGTFLDGRPTFLHESARRRAPHG